VKSLKESSQELLPQMGQYLAWIIPRTRRLKFVQIKSLRSPLTIGKTIKNLLLMNHWPECIDNWHGASFGQGDSNVFE